MFRLSKTTDYGIVLLAQLASGATPGVADPAPPQNARELAEASELPVPMVSKILKALAKEGVLDSQRGAKGGYSLARVPEDLSVAEMIRVLEGPVALTDCAAGPALCEHETMCAMREPWQVISRVVEQALAGVSLADLVRSRTGLRMRDGASLMSSMLQIDRNPHEAGASQKAPESRPSLDGPNHGPNEKSPNGKRVEIHG
jgi:FeS assembly SUF system regulator